MLALCACARAHGGEAMCPQLPLSADLPALVEEPENSPLRLSADQITLDKDGLSALLGAVHLQQGGRDFSAEALNYDESRRLVQVRAQSLFRSRPLLIRSEEADFDLNAQSGVFRNTEFTLPARSARGTAGRIAVMRGGTAEVDGMSYTTCAPGSDAWYLKASRVTLNYDEGLGTATHARLVLGGVPIFYAPYFRFPIDNRRRSGLLFPTIGETLNTGFDLRVPLYLNLAPNYDATVTPRYMSKRGTQLNNDFRYLFAESEGHASLQYLNRDQVTGEQRRLVEFQHQGLINRRLAADVHWADVSDPGYFEDLGTRTDSASITHLDRSARLTYQAPAAYTIFAMLQDYQTISRSVLPADEPYRRLPQIRVDARTPGSLYSTRAGLSAEYANFTRPNSVRGQRLDLVPYLRMEQDDAAWFTASQLDLRYTGYQLTGESAGQPANPARELPTFSAEGGLRFERVTGGGKLQTLEPRLMYLYTPYRDQGSLPLFDSGEPDFDVTQLFARNRYSGVDRIADANQVAVAMTSRLLEPDSGMVRLSASIGQLFRFQAPQVDLPGFASPGSGATDFIAGLDYRLSQNWASALGLQWSPDERKFNRANFAVRYREDGRRLDLAYRYRQNTLEQGDAIASLPLFGQWRAAGRWRYSIADSRSLDALAGLEYDTCCWALRTSYRRYVANTSGMYNSGVYIQLELKGLTRIGAGFDGLLPVNDSLPQ